MECTQKLECTQDLYNSQNQSVSKEQIGYLGICGNKYPVKRGPNKIGRDSQTCNIVLNLNSISRQHAVINILNKEEYMLMDLDSANKTKLIDKTLQPYIPYPLKNGDTVQFGQVFGIFRLLDDDNDLPMTQAIDIPDTPVASKFVSRLNNGTVTTIPESPDVSDKEDSFYIASQPITKNIFLKPSLAAKKASINNNKSTGKTSSSSMQLDDSNNSFNDLTVSIKSKDRDIIQMQDDIFDMETQVPESFKEKENVNNIYTANTQIPIETPMIHSMEAQVLNKEQLESSGHSSQLIYNMETQVPESFKEKENTDNIYTANTQIPCETQDLNNEQLAKHSIYNMETQVTDMSPNKLSSNLSPSIHSLQTQIPTTANDDLFKQSIYDCETQILENKLNQTNEVLIDNTHDESIFDALTQVIPPNTYHKSEKNDAVVNNTSDNDIIVFDEINTQSFDDVFASQPLIPRESTKQLEKTNIACQKNFQENVTLGELPKELPNSDEDINILAIQKVVTKDDDDITDCEDDIFDDYEIPENQKTGNDAEKNKNISNLPTQVIPDPIDDDLQDVLTQVVEEDHTKKEDNIGELLTQKIDEADIGDLPTQIIQVDDSSDNNPNVKNEDLSPFKKPFSVNEIKIFPKSNASPSKVTDFEDVDKSIYYQQTQDLVDDLCSQRKSPEIKIMETILGSKKSIRINLGSDDELVANTREVENKLSKQEIETSPKKETNIPHLTNNAKEIYKNNITKEAILTKIPGDTSDVEVTPKKINPFNFMITDLPNSQEIKSSITLTSRLEASESSESEIELNNSKECTPVSFKRKSRSVKQDLTEKFDIISLPDRVMTRRRKPTIKIQESIEYGQVSKNILKSKILNDLDDINSEVLAANIARLKSAAKESRLDKSKKAIKIKQELVKTSEKEESNKSETINLKSKVETNKTRIKKEKKHVDDKKETRKSETISLINEYKSEHYETTSIVRTRRQKAQSLNEENITVISANSALVNIKEDPINVSKKETKKDNSTDTATKSRSKRSTKKVALKAGSSPEQEPKVRRSKRQMNDKEKPDKKTKKEKLKNETVRREHSTVYNLSSESMNDSPKNLKRARTSDIEVQSAKRLRRTTNASINPTLRSTPADAGKIQHVLFTAFPCEEVKLKLEKLGAVIVTDVTKCTVLLTVQIKRTFKLLCAIGLGVPIVGLNWVQACADTNMLVDPWLYVMKDDSAEKRFTFSLEKTLVGKRNFLKGYNISATPKVLPAAPEMKLIVECSGGVWKEGGTNWVCVSSVGDKILWPALRKRGATIVSTEFILGGVLKQKADVLTNMFKIN